MDIKQLAKPKKWLIVCGIVLVAIFIILNINRGDNSSIPSNTINPNSIVERKKELGLDYIIVVDRTPKMSRPGRNFSAVFSPTEPQPTIEQLKTLGEIIRDEYKTEPFLWFSFWNDSKAITEDLSKYKNVDAGTAEGDAEWEIVKKVQSHLIMQYNKNDVSGLNQLKIYPNGLQTTESEDIITVNY